MVIFGVVQGPAIAGADLLSDVFGPRSPRSPPAAVVASGQTAVDMQHDAIAVRAERRICSHAQPPSLALAGKAWIHSALSS
jgi:hypothetical protein